MKKKPKVTDGGPWKGPTFEEWLARFTELPVGSIGGSRLPEVSGMAPPATAQLTELEKLADWGDR